MSEDRGSDFRSESYRRRWRVMGRVLLPFELLELAGLAICLIGGIALFLNS